MKRPSSDTHPDAERVQIGLLRAATPARRMQLLCSLSESVVAMSRRAIRNANPESSEDELAVRFVELHYGPDLAQRLSLYLQQRPQRHRPPAGSWASPNSGHQP